MSIKRNSVVQDLGNELPDSRYNHNYFNITFLHTRSFYSNWNTFAILAPSLNPRHFSRNTYRLIITTPELHTATLVRTWHQRGWNVAFAIFTFRLECQRNPPGGRITSGWQEKGGPCENPYMGGSNDGERAALSGEEREQQWAPFQ